jgi:hypothetical protein
MSRDDTARRNRELMPNVAKMVDDIRQHFPGARVIWAEDKQTGHSVGARREEATNSFAIPEDFRPSRPLKKLLEDIKSEQAAALKRKTK